MQQAEGMEARSLPPVLVKELAAEQQQATVFKGRAGKRRPGPYQRQPSKAALIAPTLNVVPRVQDRVP